MISVFKFFCEFYVLYILQIIYQNDMFLFNYIHYKVLDEITYLFPNFNDYTIVVCKCISNFKCIYLFVTGAKRISFWITLSKSC